MVRREGLDGEGRLRVTRPVDADGRQTCFADTLVAAALVDDGGALAPYYAKLAPADGGAPTAEPLSSPLSALAADKGAPQKALASAARRTGGGAMGPMEA